MYRIAILEKDEAYLERLIIFLKEHHGESFEIYTAKESADWEDLGFKDIEAEAVFFDALFLGDELAASGGFSARYGDRVSYREGGDQRAIY